MPCLLRTLVVFTSATLTITHGSTIPMQAILCYRSIGFAWKLVWGTASRAYFLPGAICTMVSTFLPHVFGKLRTQRQQ